MKKYCWISYKVDEVITDITMEEKCLSAIADMESGMETIKWLGEYLKFYTNVTYEPQKHSIITDSCYHERSLIRYQH